MLKRILHKEVDRFEKTVAERPQTLARYEEALRGILADARALGWIPIIGTPIRLPLSSTSQQR